MIAEHFQNPARPLRFTVGQNGYRVSESGVAEVWPVAGWTSPVEPIEIRGDVNQFRPVFHEVGIDDLFLALRAREFSAVQRSVLAVNGL